MYFKFYIIFIINIIKNFKETIKLKMEKKNNSDEEEEESSSEEENENSFFGNM